MKAIVAASLLAFACAHTTAAPNAELTKWQTAHPGAARELCAVDQQYPQMSMRLRNWVLDHPIQAQELIGWAATNRGTVLPEPLITARPGWYGVVPVHDPALHVLLGWAADNPEAAQALADDPQGLRAVFLRSGC